ncbi:uncharacterized protein YjdB [Paenibacillus castaneae]|uniref:Ig-like domain-containing protein n=1 Tax=Paenibacillus castaneae TaxID=474957 RepID=UPI000C9CF5BB|nr:DUF4350 domain-containing protein [Paenibacillus castaneae]NIK78274.1 uncharacterized protein YjdB [Paenibacillus castaneae]
MLSFTRKNKKWISLAMAVVMILSVLLPVPRVTYADTSSLLAKWDNFSATNLYANDGNDANKGKAATAISAVGLAKAGYSYSGTGLTNPAISANNWLPGTSYWVVNFSTKGYSDIKLSSMQAGSPTGPKSFNVQYSLDNSVWSQIDSYNVGSTSATPVDYVTGTLSNISLPAAVNDQSSVFIRWVVDADSKTVGDAVIPAAGTGSGTNRIANISVTGTPLPSGPVSVTGVTLDKTALHVSVGGTAALVAQVLPANATNSSVTWTSSDSSVATVVNGTVSAINEGTATITAVTVDGSFQATATVNVSSGPISVTGVTLNKSSLDLTAGGTDQLTAIVQPVTATNPSVTWNSDNENVALVDANGKITAKGAGTAKITATTLDGGFTSSAVVNVTLSKTVDPVVSKITFPSLTNVTGAASSVAGGSLVTLYFLDQTVAGTTVAAADGSFNLLFSNPSSKTEFTIAAQEDEKGVSNKVALTYSAYFNPGDVVISQFYPNGGNSGAFYKTKFIELYNRSNQDINFNNNWSLQYIASTGTTPSASNSVLLSGTIKAHSYYLVTGKPGTTGLDLPIAGDQTASISPSASIGGVLALSQKSGNITGAADSNIVDLLAYGNGSDGGYPVANQIQHHKIDTTTVWGKPFFDSSYIGAGTIVRKTNEGSDPRAAFGLGNGWFTPNNASDFVLNRPSNNSNPAEIVIRNSTYMEAPNAAKITFSETGGNATVTGAAGSVPASSTVHMYVVNSGVITLAGQTPAAADGTFSFSFSDANHNQSVYVTHTDASQQKSGYARIDSASYSKPQIMNIGDLHVNDMNGIPMNLSYSATIQGVVTSDNGSIGNGQTSFYMQDSTGGIEVIGGTSPSAAIAVGNKVTISGKVVYTAGMTQFVAATITDSVPDTAPAAASITLDKLSNFTAAEALEGKLVSVRGKVTNIPSAGPDYNVTITDELGNIAIVKILSASGIDVNSVISLGDTYSFTGILGQFQLVSPYTSGYYIKPRKASDIKGDLYLNHAPLTKAYTGLDIPVKAIVKYADSVTLYYKNEGDASFASISMAAADSVNYNVKIPKENVKATKILYYIVAQSAGQPSQSSGDANTPNSVDMVTDTDGPAFLNQLPDMMDVVESFHPVISVDLDDPNGVDVSSLSIAIDGHDFTSKAVMSELQIKLSLSSNDDLTIGTHTVTVAAKDKLGNSSTHSWTFQIAPRFTGGNHYRGTTHNHTQISHDAKGNPEQALLAAQAYGYDYFAFSDHSHDIDASLVGKDTVDHNGMPQRTGGSDWKLTKDLAKGYTKDGEFVVFPAFEMTSTTWGHSNVFGTTDFIDRVQDGGKYQNLQNYYAWTLTYDNIVAQFNHPAMSSNAFDNFIPYDKNVDKLFTMLEVGNGSGNYSYVNVENKFFSALDLGWHIAPTYGEDNHDATWGQTKKRTVIVANDLSQESLLDAMKKMHVYFSEDPNFQLDVLANGYYMGATVDSKALGFNVTGSDPVSESSSDPKYKYLDKPSNDNIAKVELITNGGRVIDSYTPASDSTSFNWKPSVNVVGGQQWFVIRVTQKDGDKIYSAPIWSPADPMSVKVNDLTIAEGAAISGIPVTLKAGISNLGTINLTNLKALFYYDSIDSAHFIGDAVIESLASNKNAYASVNWTSPVAGDHKLIVVLSAGDGNDLGDNKYEQAIIVKAPLGVKVMIDATHNNENTTSDTGTYANNLTNLTLNLKQQGYTVSENKDALTDQLLSDVGVLMVTHPSSAYSAGEIAVLKKFVNRGGSLLLTEKSNFGGTQQNLNSLLTGIGSSILVNNDGVFDETASGNFWSTPLTSNFSVRLHLAPVSNGLTDFVSLLDFYSGSSLAGNDGAGNKIPLTNSGTVTILASGNESTFQDSPQVKADTVKYNVQTANGKSGPALTDVTGGAVIPLVASEQLGSGRIFVAGMNVFNDKQMTQNDGPTNNVPFGLNVINWLSHLESKVTSIGDVRLLPEETNVVVQGKVTTTAFYDSVYVQDETGGIVAFGEVPDGSLQLGDTVRVYGRIGSFENDKELIFDRFANSVVKISSGPAVQPKSVSTADSVSEAYQGQLVQVKGKVTSIPNESTYVINDGSGDVKVFIDGYISNKTGAPVQIGVGDTIVATGLSGKYSLGNRIRVRDTKELLKVTGTDPTDPITPVSGVTLDKASLDLTVGGTSRLNATVEPVNATNQTVTWTSSNALVAIVDANGLVTAVSSGMATITATTLEGSFIAESTVKVTADDSSNGNGGNGNTGSGDNSDTNTGSQSAIITPDKLSNNEGGKTTVVVPANTLEVVLPWNTADLIKQNDLLIKSDKITMIIPSDLIRQLSGKLSAEEQKESTISLKLSPLSDTDARNIIAKSSQAVHADLKLGGDVYDLHLSMTTANGKSVALSKFDKPITIQLKVDSAMNSKWTGIYYISDNGTLEYVGGKYVDGYMIAEISHFSKYAVIEVSKTFIDVPASHWAANVIKELAAKQIVSGTSDTTYEPNRNVTRAEFTTLLVRALKLTEKADVSFADVKSSDWYAEAIAIAVKAGITQGKSAVLFDANARITREEMVTMLMRAHAYVNGKQSVHTDMKFADASQISSWAVESVKSAAALQLIQGRGAGKFDPKGITTRAEAAQVIYNLLNK